MPKQNNKYKKMEARNKRASIYKNLIKQFVFDEQ